MDINVITAVFGSFRSVITAPINYQYDQLQKLRIVGLALPQYFEADFCNDGDAQTITMTGTDGLVTIPDQLLSTGKPVQSYIVLTDGDSVQTRYKVTIPINSRPARSDIEPTTAEQQQIDALVDALNDGVDRAEAAVVHSPTIIDGEWHVWDGDSGSYQSTGVQAQGPAGADGADGADGAQGPAGVGVPTGGATGQVLKKKSGANYDTEWADESGGGGGTSDYTDLTNKPQIGGVTLIGDKSLSDLGVAAAEDIPTKTSDLTNDSGYITSAPVASVNGKTGAVVLDAEDVGALPDDTPIPPAVTEQTVAGWGFTKNTGTYSKPSSGIPKSDLASAVQTSLGKADTALQSYTETDPTVPSWAKASSKPSYTKSEVGLGNVDNVQQYSASNPPPYPVSSVNGQTGAVSLSIPSTAADVGAIESPSTPGTNGQVLTSDGAGGASWQTPSGGGDEWTVLHDSTLTEEAIIQIAITDIDVSEIEVWLYCTASASPALYISPQQTNGSHNSSGYGRTYISCGTTTGSPKMAYGHLLKPYEDLLFAEIIGNGTYLGSVENAKLMPIKCDSGKTYAPNNKYTAVSVATYQAMPIGSRVIVRGK